MQGQLWGSRPRDFANYLEQLTLPLLGAALDAARVVPGTRLLDAGCGAGLGAVLARFRGAKVSGIDASAALLQIARERLPDADLRLADLEELPFADASFDAVTAVNSLFYAADMNRAMRELNRVTLPGGRVVVTAWGPPNRCQLLSALLSGIGPLMPPPPPGAPRGHPATLSEPGALAAVVKSAGMRVVGEGEVACPFVFADTEASWRANASAGPNQVAIAHSGEAAVRAAFAEIERAHARPDGTIRYENVFIWVTGERET
jgi:SAM-dependent methyltransferase